MKKKQHEITVKVRKVESLPVVFQVPGKETCLMIVDTGLTPKLWASYTKSQERKGKGVKP